jgi:hypothetical protein
MTESGATVVFTSVIRRTVSFCKWGSQQACLLGKSAFGGRMIVAQNGSAAFTNTSEQNQSRRDA